MQQAVTQSKTEGLLGLRCVWDYTAVFVANRMASKCWFGDTESEEHWAGRHGCVLSSKSYLYEFIDLFRDCSRIQHSTAGYTILKGGHAWSFWVSASCWLLQSQSALGNLKGPLVPDLFKFLEDTSHPRGFLDSEGSFRMLNSVWVCPTELLKGIIFLRTTM